MKIDFGPYRVINQYGTWGLFVRKGASVHTFAQTLGTFGKLDLWDRVGGMPLFRTRRDARDYIKEKGLKRHGVFTRQVAICLLDFDS